MRKVIDNNALQSEELARYLAANPKNIAVLTSFTAVESHHGNAVTNIASSMAILANFPRQVLILKGTQQLCGLHPRNKGLQRRMVDEPMSDGFPDYCRDLKMALAGDAGRVRRILELGHEATDLTENILAGVPDIVAARKQLASTYSAEQIRNLRGSQPYSEELIRAFIQNVMALAFSVLARHPRVRKLPQSFELLANTYLFRYSLATQLWTLNWIAQGSNAMSDSKIQHDLFDLHIATCATYFDGLMTSDAKAASIHAEMLAHLAVTRQP